MIPSGLVRSSVVPVACSSWRIWLSRAALDVDLAGGVEEAGLSGEGEDPADALLGARAGEAIPDRRRERAASAEAGRWVSASVRALPHAWQRAEQLRSQLSVG